MINTVETFISVLVIAYKRKQFLYQALNSLTEQTLDKNYYEIAVITDFEVLDEKNFIEKGIIFFRDERKEYCKKMSSVIGSLKGNVICILDDDDLFFAEKLSTIFKIFSENEDISFVQNNMCIIGKNGEVIRERFYSFPNELVNVKSEIDSYGYFKKLFKMKFGFNGSSISVRKEVITQNIEILSLMSGSVEAFLWLSSISQGKKSYFENNILTAYRIHDDNNSVALLNEKRRGSMYKRHLSDWKSLHSLSQGILSVL